MFRKRKQWHKSVVTALFVAGLFYKVARLFMKSVDRLQTPRAPRGLSGRDRPARRKR
jgi:hypothetical protein